MMKEILIATSNIHKVEEFRQMLEPLGYTVKSLLDLKEQIDIEENGETFAENALIKARTVHQLMHTAVISDDSGLSVDAMDGAPGVYSARFLGYDTDYAVKNQYIIDQVKGKERGAQFVCAIGYVEEDGTEHVFTGVVRGEIAPTKRPVSTALAMLRLLNTHRIKQRWPMLQKNRKMRYHTADALWNSLLPF